MVEVLLCGKEQNKLLQLLRDKLVHKCHQKESK